MSTKTDISNNVISTYKKIVEAHYPGKSTFWPLISGCDTKFATFHGTLIIAFIHTGTRAFQKSDGLGELSSTTLDVSDITIDNCDQVRSKLENFLSLKQQDGIIFIKQDIAPLAEFQKLLERHELVMGGGAMKIFLSHKVIDKPMVRDFSDTLLLLGFQPWLDEDAMTAGVELERGILQGFKESCAAVFFITPDFKDESCLASEINYAIAQKREKGNRFSIVTIVFSVNDKKGSVPDLLKQYVWKEPSSHLAALQEIIKALPIKIGNPKWK